MFDLIYDLKIWDYPAWNYIYLGNALGDYALAIGYFIVFLVVFKIFQSVILYQLNRLADKTKTDLDDKLIDLVESVRPAFYSFLALYLAIGFIKINDLVHKIIMVVFITWIVYQTIISLHSLIDYAIRKYSEKNASTSDAINLLGRVAKISLWFIGTLLVLSNLGVDISSLIAGLGIGGIAIALALQNILSDLFSSFAIHFDKPFVVGDFIMVENKMGTVEKIGIKTTRLRALQGEEIVISNRELTNAQIQNFKKLKERRISFSFGVKYNTSQEKLGKISEIIKKNIDNIDKARFDRAHFKKFSDSSLDFEVVYYVEEADYTKYMDIQQDINMGIKGEFEKEKIEFAYPTQTIYIEK